MRYLGSTTWSRTLLVSLSVAITSLSTLSGCASVPEAPAPELEEGKLAIVHHKCDEFGIAALQVVVTGPGVYTISWSNKDVCGYPT